MEYVHNTKDESKRFLSRGVHRSKRNVADVVDVKFTTNDRTLKGHNRGFDITFREENIFGRGDSFVTIKYEAMSAVEAAEIVAKLRFYFFERL